MKSKKNEEKEKNEDKEDKSAKVKIVEKEEICDKNNKEEKDITSKKALFIQRFVAYCIDIIIVSFVVSIVALPFYNDKEMSKYEEKSNELVEKYTTNKISVEKFMLESANVSYQMARDNGIVSIATIIFEILYFIVYQLYNGGQTLGKKLMKIKIVSTKGELTMNQIMFRALIINSIMLELISFGFMLFSSKEVYFFGVGIFEIIQTIVIVISALLIMYSKKSRGIHDLVTHTEVLKI